MGYMAIKLDLEKAYDKLEWSFIHKVLQAFHFPPNLIRVIMGCVTSLRISVLVNGGALDSFYPSRGIRQEDPFSPYLFILCMEYLSHLIEHKCREGSWTPLKASRGNVGIPTYYLWMILSYLAKWTSWHVMQLLKFWRSFVKSLDRKLVKESPVYTTPQC